MPADDVDFVDFDSAEEFLRIARASHAQGDTTQFRAACKLISVALNMTVETLGVKLHTSHLKV